ncbi:hypothetical protein K438DRAFT_1749649 [Mycena galopus ATCC 62051]|nr:hypothetical protein K438DRAFT_1749649 [Mycena galopus ATCC 62051]
MGWRLGRCNGFQKSWFQGHARAEHLDRRKWVGEGFEEVELPRGKLSAAARAARHDAWGNYACGRWYVPGVAREGHSKGNERDAAVHGTLPRSGIREETGGTYKVWATKLAGAGGGRSMVMGLYTAHFLFGNLRYGRVGGEFAPEKSAGMSQNDLGHRRIMHITAEVRHACREQDSEIVGEHRFEGFRVAHPVKDMSPTERKAKEAPHLEQNKGRGGGGDPVVAAVACGPGCRSYENHRFCSDRKLRNTPPLTDYPLSLLLLTFYDLDPRYFLGTCPLLRFQFRIARTPRHPEVKEKKRVKMGGIIVGSDEMHGKVIDGLRLVRVRNNKSRIFKKGTFRIASTPRHLELKGKKRVKMGGIIVCSGKVHGKVIDGLHLRGLVRVGKNKSRIFKKGTSDRKAGAVQKSEVSRKF